MVDTPKKLIDVTLTGATDTVYTAPGSTTTIIGYISFTNKSGASVDVDMLAGVAASEKYIRKAMTIAAGDTKEFYGPLVVETGEVVKMIADAGAAIDVHGSGFEAT